MRSRQTSVMWLLVLTLVLMVVAPATQADDGCWECWGPGLIDPCRNTLYDVAIVPGTAGGQAWAVGEAGTILHWSGGVWTKMASPTHARLYGVGAANANLAIALGVDGAVFKWDGAHWSTLPSFSTGNWMRDIAFAPETNGAQGWAAGDKNGVGYFYYWDGTTLKLKYNNDYKRYGGIVSEVDLLSMADGWASGYLAGQGYVHHWDGSDWTTTLIGDLDIQGIAPVAANDVWAVGEDGCIYHFDGAAWTAWGDSPADDDLRDVDFAGSGHGWAVGQYGELLRWNGSTWSHVYSGVSKDLHAVDLEGTEFGWAVGEGGVILHWDGHSWTTFAKPEVSRWEDLSITPGSGGTDMWAVGGGKTLLHWDGVSWRPVQGPNEITSYYSVSMVNANDGWASGPGGRMAHWNGTNWQFAADIESIAALEAVGPNDVWGFGWSRIQHWDGASWSEVPCPVSKTFYNSQALATNDIWAVGDGGTVVHYDGSSWQVVPLSYNYVLWDIGLASATEGFATASYGNLFKWNGSGWSEVNHGLTSDAIRTVDVVSSSAGTVGWALGEYGLALRYKNGTWSAGCCDSGNYAIDVQHISPYEAWAVGDNGVVLHWLDPERPRQDNFAFLPMIRR